MRPKVGDRIRVVEQYRENWRENCESGLYPYPIVDEYEVVKIDESRGSIDCQLVFIKPALSEEEIKIREVLKKFDGDRKMVYRGSLGTTWFERVKDEKNQDSLQKELEDERR